MSEYDEDAEREHWFRVFRVGALEAENSRLIALLKKLEHELQKHQCGGANPKIAYDVCYPQTCTATVQVQELKKAIGGDQ